MREWLKSRRRSLALLPDYLRAVIQHWNDILFLSIPTFPFVVWWFVGSPPMWLIIFIFIWVFLVAGYYAWRAERVRFLPKMTFATPPFRFHDQSTSDPLERRRYLQILPECLGNGPVIGCQGHLLRVMRWDNEEWQPTEFDHAMGLVWSYLDAAVPRTLYPGIDYRLNLLFVSLRQDRRGLALTTQPQNFALASLRDPPPIALRFDIRITGENCAPLDISLKVRFKLAESPAEWFNLEVEGI
jgi:hypothetical protein